MTALRILRALLAAEFVAALAAWATGHLPWGLACAISVPLLICFLNTWDDRPGE